MTEYRKRTCPDDQRPEIHERDDQGLPSFINDNSLSSFDDFANNVLEKTTSVRNVWKYELRTRRHLPVAGGGSNCV